MHCSKAKLESLKTSSHLKTCMAQFTCFGEFIIQSHRRSPSCTQHVSTYQHQPSPPKKNTTQNSKNYQKRQQMMVCFLSFNSLPGFTRLWVRQGAVPSAHCLRATTGCVVHDPSASQGGALALRRRNAARDEHPGAVKHLNGNWPWGAARMEDGILVNWFSFFFWSMVWVVVPLTFGVVGTVFKWLN